MDEWFHDLPISWMALIIFGTAYLTAGGILAIVMRLAKRVGLRAFNSVSAGLLAPLGTIFGLLVVFIVAQVWSDLDRASRHWIARRVPFAWWCCWHPVSQESRRHKYKPWSAATLTKPYIPNGPRWLNSPLL